MIIIPAVDVRYGKCVQMVQGKPGTEKYYGDPVKVAKIWEEKGAQMLHVIDIDAALGEGDNLDVIVDIHDAVDIPIQFGGGIRGPTYARVALEAGIDRIIFGSLSVKNPKLVRDLSREYGKDRIMVAVDSLKGEVVIHGWTERTGIKTIDQIKKMERYVFGFLVTDVDKEGLLKGVDIKEFEDLVKATNARICASGGITTNKDIKALEGIGVWGCVIGKALYEGRIKLPKPSSPQ